MEFWYVVMSNMSKKCEEKKFISTGYISFKHIVRDFIDKNDSFPTALMYKNFEEFLNKTTKFRK